MADSPLNAWINSTVQLGTAEQIHAYGLIALAYNLLEDSLILLFDAYFPVSTGDETGPGFVCAHMLNNRQRLDLLKALVDYDEKSDEVKSRVDSAIAMFEICSENRNILAHGRRDNADFDPEIFVIRKMASGSPLREIFFDLSLDELRETANEVLRTVDYFFELGRYLVAHRLTDEQLKEMYGSDYEPPLPEKPRIPRKLSPRPRPKGPEDAQSQPKPFRQSQPDDRD